MLWIGIAIVLLVAGGFYYFHRTYHLLTVQPGVLYRCGLQNFGEFENAVRKTKPKTIITLVDDPEIADAEKPQFKREIDTYTGGNGGATVARVPIKLGGWPDGDQCEQFLAILADPQKQPVLVHCAQGVRRTGMLVAAYQMSVLGYDKERAVKELETFGHSERTVGDIKRFIECYDPVTRRMTKSLPMSKE
ncbi:fused DSP-PTPase phosphatase/NAD kinase-like protein [Humisphaera borealis]|uniref:protein-tyrosine-phosphatase n=1 Tax=Humisphaera borealis TaxID=2807512 RepID=A0A7M2WQ67_9BACT|nr:tyrosine-protein phosphatase [Humisphaera borealis]QOV87539.1 tyrosine-protein phosphatase [Humisphaera borealis]